MIATGQEIEEEINLNGTTPVTTAFAYDVPITIAKDITVGDVTVNAATDYSQPRSYSCEPTGTETSASVVPAAA